MFIATLVAGDALSAGEISSACDAVRGRAGPRVDGIACDVRFEGDPKAGRAAVEAAVTCDVIVQAEADRARTLLVGDMDSTMITVECIDELADYAGIKPQVSAVTERAMRGEIDFAGALRDRVALLAGMKESVIAECLRERVKIMGGAKALVRTMRARGGTAVLVSGGFTHFTGPVAAEIGFDRAVANRLIVRGGVLTGEVEQPIVDAETKKAELLKSIAALGISTRESMAIGDGANDIPMIEAAGLGVAYHAKPKTEAAADTAVRVGDLSVLLYAMGLPKAEWRDE
jgi:phosphoserine phosphatase